MNKVIQTNLTGTFLLQAVQSECAAPRPNFTISLPLPALRGSPRDFPQSAKRQQKAAGDFHQGFGVANGACNIQVNAIAQVVPTDIRKRSSNDTETLPRYT